MCIHSAIVMVMVIVIIIITIVVNNTAFRRNNNRLSTPAVALEHSHHWSGVRVHTCVLSCGAITCYVPCGDFARHLLQRPDRCGRGRGRGRRLRWRLRLLSLDLDRLAITV